MSYYKTCPLCGATLDPGEECECNDVFILIDTIEEEENETDD